MELRVKLAKEIIKAKYERHHVAALIDLDDYELSQPNLDAKNEALRIAYYLLEHFTITEKE